MWIKSNREHKTIKTVVYLCILYTMALLFGKVGMLFVVVFRAASTALYDKEVQ